MVCKHCGNIVVKTDKHCKVCGKAFLPDTISNSLERQERFADKVDSIAEMISASQEKAHRRRYRSRLMLLLIFWIGGYLGLHYAWMGDSDSACCELKKVVKHFLLCFVGVGIVLFMIDLVIYLFNFFAIIFGKYPIDYEGNPIVWSKLGKPELT